MHGSVPRAGVEAAASFLELRGELGGSGRVEAWAAGDDPAAGVRLRLPDLGKLESLTLGFSGKPSTPHRAWGRHGQCWQQPGRH